MSSAQPQQRNPLSNWSGLVTVVTRAIKKIKPPVRMKISEWADSFRIIGAANATPGRWKTDNAPYQREPMDCMSDRRTRRVSLMWSAQVGKTEIANNVVGYHIAQNPMSVMFMQPTQSDLKTWQETKLTPLLTDTKQIAEVVAKPRGREGVNNQLMKSYPGGFLMFSWSGSANTMRGRSAPIIICDEIDGYSVTEEGDPVQLLHQRSATFGDLSKLLEISTPTIKGFSRIEKAFEAGDKRYFYVPCPHCREFQRLQWSQVQWEKDEDGTHLPHTALYYCEHCGVGIEDKYKFSMLEKGVWTASKRFMGHASFHLNELYSPWRTWAQIVESFLAKKAAGDSQSFINVSLAETWEEDGEVINESTLMSRKEVYVAECPQGVIVITVGVDVQPDRLELEVVGWGMNEESWSIAFAVLPGDPDDFGEHSVWNALDDYLDRRFLHESGVELSILASCIDSGGNNTQSVYKYCAKRKSSRRFAIKGQGGVGVPIVSAAKKKKSGKRGRPVDLYMVGVDQCKTLLYRRLEKEVGTAGSCHFPDHYPDTYFEQLTAEKCITRYIKGFPKREWVKIRPRNEALDCRNYAYAALNIMNPSLTRYQKRIEKQAAELESVQKGQTVVETQEETTVQQRKVKPKTKRKRRPRRRSGFVSG
ncbi:phage terminase large subunit family protein [Halodesulfovibrio aestuarii]|uniref:Phage terminase large subunit family protein n=1 Tax=Halodesulfovibrio aestuarii TaxID=126333 RepID=A0ABV4JTL3_9BACT